MATAAPAGDATTFDADNHYYEATDAFTRHIDPRMAKRAMQWAEVDGRQRLLVGGKICKFIPNPTFDPVAKPGSLDEYFRGRNPQSKSIGELFGELEPVRPEYRDRDARLAVMDDQGIDGCFLFPTLGVGMEEALAHDPPRWWPPSTPSTGGSTRTGATPTATASSPRPMITLVDVDAAVAELEEVLDRDARIVCIKGGPAHTPHGLTSPGDARFDPFWARVNEAGVTVGIHSGDAGYAHYMDDWEPSGDFEAFRYGPLRSILTSDRPPFETMAALVCHGVFDRFPKVRVASIEAGSEWLLSLRKKFDKVYGQLPTAFPSNPLETLREHVWVSPYYEDDLAAVKDVIGVDHLLFGSDWPHAEGLAEPRSFADDLRRHGFTEAEVNQVMNENGFPLTVRAP